MIEKNNYTSYEIKGISKEKEGEYKATGSIEGKSGTLEIEGDIKDTTFKYTLTDFMDGDETFYCKVNIDGEEYIQEISIIQGDIVTYEEDFAGIEYTSGTWIDDNNENYNDGIAKVVNTTEESAQLDFNFTGTGLEIISRINENAAVVKTSMFYAESNVFEKTRNLKNIEELFKVDINKGQIQGLENKRYSVSITALKSIVALDYGKYCYLDAIIVYK